MEKIEFHVPDSKETVEFYVVEQTKIGGIGYLLVTIEENGDSDALILKDVAALEEQEAVYEIVESEQELEAISKVFSEILEDINLIS